MKITYREARVLGRWEKIIQLTGISLWALNEAQLDEDAVLDIEVK